MGNCSVDAAVLISEFMANNESSLVDEDGDHSDWIEIHNGGAGVMNLSGWSLTDDATEPGKWRFPDGVLLAPGGYLIVFASDKNRTTGTPWHTNFRLSSDGEYLGLHDTQGHVVSAFSPAFPPQNPDVSYGRSSTDSNTLLFFSTPTPGAINDSGETGFAGEVAFSRPSGVFLMSEPFLLDLSTTTPDATIHYTLDENAPGPGSLEYSAPIAISGSTVVRARASGPGLVEGPTSSHTYIALAPDAEAFSSDLPVMVLHNFGQGFVPATKEDQRVSMLGFEPRLPADLSTAPRSALTDPPVHAERGIFHVRGFLTAVDSDKGKASFLLEIQDESDAGKEEEVFGLPRESDWVLYAVNSFDRALIQNPLAHQLRRDMGGYSPRTRFFELFLKDDNGAPGPITMDDYYGLFVLEEKIKRDGNRVDIDALQPEHMNPPEVTGGYLLSIDDPNGEPQLVAGGAIMNFIDPKGVEVYQPERAAQLDYIRNYFNSFNAALNGPNWRDPVLGYAAYIDVDSWIDYHLHAVLTFNADALRLSTYLYKPRNGKIQFGPPWDFDISQGSAGTRDFNPLIWRSTAFGGSTDYFNHSPWWFKLFRDTDFWQRWIDRYQELRHATLSTEHIYSLIEAFSDEVREAQVREQNRWEVYPRTGPVSSDGFFHYFGSEPSYDNEIEFKKVWYSQRLRFIDSQFLDRPLLTSAGGKVEPGFELVVVPPSEPGTSVIVTLDGSDPRLSGGGISPSAIVSSEPLVLSVSTNIRLVARSHNLNHSNRTGPNNPPVSSPWSGPIRARFHTEVPALRITEIMYHPAGPPVSAAYIDEDFEFIEVTNIGGVPLNVSEFRLSGGIDFVFPEAVLQPGEPAVIVANLGAFGSRYPWGPRVLGSYDRRLNNTGERLVLEGPMGEPIHDFEYDETWYPITDGGGFSLVINIATAPHEDWHSKESWRPSTLYGGSPAATDAPPSSIPQVVVNEVQPTPSGPVVELLNLSTEQAAVGGWQLTDEFAGPGKFSIPFGTFIEPGGFIAFHATTIGFGASRGAVHLFSTIGGIPSGYTHGYEVGPVESGVSFGRHVTGTGDEEFPEQTSPTLGMENAGPRVGPVVISEIYYHPPDLVIGANEYDHSRDEFIELYNTSDEPVPLYVDNPSEMGSAHGWRMTDAVEFEFESDQVIPAGAVVLVVGFDSDEAQLADAFRARHNVPLDVPVLGPFDGRLSDSADRLELRRPLSSASGAPFQPVYTLVERVEYKDHFPWPGDADGLGRSLRRIDLLAYGNDAANWESAAPSPGRVFDGGNEPLIVELDNGVVRIGGTLTAEMDWSPSMGTLHVVSTVHVPGGVTLTIQPGTEVLIASGAGIQARDSGAIHIAGTAEQRVILAPLIPGALWNELSANGVNSSLTVRHADISGGRTAVRNGAEGLFEDVFSHDFRPVACPLLDCPILLSSFPGSMIVRRCHFRDYFETLFRDGVFVIEDSLFEYVAGDGLDLDAAQPGTVVRRCTFRHGTLGPSNIDAIDVGPGQLGASRGVLIEDCLMFDFPTDKGISIGDAPHPAADIVIRNCLIYGCRFGVQVKDGAVAEVSQSTIVGNDWGLNNYNKSDPSAVDGGGHIANAHNNIFWSNGTTVSMLNSGTLTADHSNFGNISWPGIGNIRANPFFANAVLDDYRLRLDSTSRRAGRHGANMGARFPVGAPMASSHPIIQSVELDDGNLVIRFWADSEMAYCLESISTLSEDTWKTIIEYPMRNVPEILEVKLSGTADDQHYYRLVAIP